VLPSLGDGSEKEKSCEDSREAAEDWKVEAISAFTKIALRLIDRDHVGSFLTFCVLVIMLVLAFRMPADQLARLPSVVTILVGHVNVFLGIALLISWSAVVILAMAVALQRRIYRAEIDRMADAKRTLEESIDPDRPSTKSRIEPLGSTEDELEAPEDGADKRRFESNNGDDDG